MGTNYVEFEWFVPKNRIAFLKGLRQVLNKIGSEFFPGGVLFYHPCDRAENVHIPTRETKYAVSTNDEFLDAFTAKNDPSILPVCASQ